MTTDDLPGTVFVTSSACTLDGCVEAGRMPDGRVAIRSTRDRARPAQVFDDTEWADFVIGVKNGEFDFC